MRVYLPPEIFKGSKVRRGRAKTQKGECEGKSDAGRLPGGSPANRQGKKDPAPENGSRENGM